MLIKSSEPSFMTAAQGAARRNGYASKAELALRNALETFCRERWPEARVVHEMVMGAGQVRADVAALCPAHIAAFEVKGRYDDTTRLLHQVGMYQLCVPEVWMVVAQGHADDARLIHHLLPSVGLLVGAGQSDRYDYEFDGKDFGLVVEAEAAPRPVVPKMMLEMLWAAELAWACNHLRVAVGKKATRPTMIKALLDTVSPEELQRATCAALRAREALWRADPALSPKCNGGDDA